MIEFEAAPDRVRFTAAYRRHLRRLFMPYRGTGLSLGGLAVVALLPAPRMVATLLAASAVLFFFFSPALMLHRAVEGAWRRNRGPTCWTLSEEGLRGANEEGYGLVRWSAVTRVEQLRDQLYVKVDGGAAIFLPTVSLPAEKQQELLAFLRARGLLA
ncbi:YcxB family protein [Micromonospora sp. AP08]|uniref:YcxB family protein n=1 Tax=Micromonospora sp. AP08 TaxID=2604467 RepID=UPI0011D56598|nr:YcxB family protein [Micromonospora sp. AP08]TYB37595.1 YcxB family protein [Micromonospora sp. AP08]